MAELKIIICYSCGAKNRYPTGAVAVNCGSCKSALMRTCTFCECKAILRSAQMPNICLLCKKPFHQYEQLPELRPKNYTSPKVPGDPRHFKSGTEGLMSEREWKEFLLKERAKLRKLSKVPAKRFPNNGR